MSENLFPRNVNYEELQKLNETVGIMAKHLQMQQKYIESIPDNVQQSIEESCTKNVLPGVNEFTHDEVTSMYYHIQTSMSDEYKKQAKKIEQVVNDKFDKNIELQKKMLMTTINELFKKESEKHEKNRRLLLINTILSGTAALLALIGTIIIAVVL